jgi:hypothetical protein
MSIHPGPWRVKHGYQIVDGNGVRIVDAERTGLNDATIQDCLRLIAAAPAMLKALQAVYAGVVKSRNEERLVINISLQAFKDVEAAISKATEPE